MSSNFEASQAAHADAQYGFTPAEKINPNETFFAYVNALFERDFQLYYFFYSHSIKLDALAENTNYVVPVRLNMQKPRSPGISQFRGRIGSPGRQDPLFVPKGHAHLGLGINTDMLHRHAELLFGDLPPRALQFEPSFSSDRTFTQTIAQIIKLAAEEEHHEPWSLRDPIRARAFLESVLNILLIYQPHSLSHLLKQKAGPAPRDVKRTIDFIEASIEDDISLATLVTVAGVPGRTLNEHFRQFTGLSPMAYLRKRRLEAAHNLLKADDTDSVTDVALRFGFNNTGRFSGAYRRAFGESPSQTLRGTRNRR